MIGFETRTSRVALWGRVADELTRASLDPRRFRARLAGTARAAVHKSDGHFVFADLSPSPPDHRVELTGREYQARSLDVAWPGGAPVAVAPAGEDELQVIVTDVDTTRISFAAIPFLPRIPAGAAVIGGSGGATVLAEDLEGVDVGGAEVQSGAAVSAGDVLRIVRSGRLLLRPGPYYRFPQGTTVVALRVVEDTLGDPPLGGAQARISALNGVALAAVVVGGVTLFRAALPAVPAPPPPPPPPPVPFLLGTDAARTAFTNARGDAVFYYPSQTPLTSLTVAVSRAGYVAQTVAVPVQPAERTFEQVRLVRS